MALRLQCQSAYVRGDILETEQTLDLIKRAQEGDKTALEELISKNSPLIKSVIRRYRNRTEYDDLFQLGSIGFIKAVKNYSADFGVKFSTYAVPMILGEVKRFLRDDGIIKVSRTTKSLACKISYFVETYKKKNAASPTIDEIAAEFDIEPQEAVFIMDSTQFPLSLSDKTDGEGTMSLIDKIPAPADDDKFDKMMLKSFIETLNERDRKIILLRYYRDKTQSEVAKVLNVSQVQVSRLENSILERMRASLK